MPVDLFLVGLIAALGGISAAAALALWPRIRSWCESSLLPWVDHNLPQFAPRVRGAFAALDHAATSARRAIKQAWQQLRAFLLHQVVTLERRSAFQWAYRVVSWVLKLLPGGERQPVQVVAENLCSWDELPAEVRSAWLRQGQQRHDVDATACRDQELAAC